MDFDLIETGPTKSPKYWTKSNRIKNNQIPIKFWPNLPKFQPNFTKKNDSISEGSTKFQLRLFKNPTKFHKKSTKLRQVQPNFDPIYQIFNQISRKIDQTLTSSTKFRPNLPKIEANLLKWTSLTKLKHFQPKPDPNPTVPTQFQSKTNWTFKSNRQSNNQRRSKSKVQTQPHGHKTAKMLNYSNPSKPNNNPKKSKRSQTKIRLNYSFSRERTNQQMTVNVRKCASPDHKMKSDNAASKTQPNQHETASVSRTNWHGINQVTIIVEPIKPNGHQIDPRLESIDEGNQMLTAFHGISAPPPPSLFTLVSSYAN